MHISTCINVRFKYEKQILTGVCDPDRLVQNDLQTIEWHELAEACFGCRSSSPCLMFVEVALRIDCSYPYDYVVRKAILDRCIDGEVIKS